MRNAYILFAIFSLATVKMYAQDNCSGTTLAPVKSGETNSTLQLHEPVGPIKEPTGLGPTVLDERMIWWAHGLGGNGAAWQRAIAATEDNIVPGYPARKSVNIPLDYSIYMSSITASAASMKTTMQVTSSALGMNNEERQQAIWLAHSMGGIVGRQLDYLYDLPENSNERQFGGIVTFGTAHQGAKIINNAVPVEGNAPVLDFFEETCNELTIGPVTETVYNSAGQSFFLRLFVDQELIEDVAGGVCATLKPLVPNLFEDFNQQITQDFKYGAEFMEQLNQNNSSIPKLVFWGEEDDETMFWRTMHYILNNPNDENYFDAIHDDIAVDWATENALRYEAKYTAYSKLSQYYNYFLNAPCLVPAWNCDPCAYYGLVEDCGTIFTLDQAQNIRDKYRQGLQWWATANDRYRAIVGAAEQQCNVVQEFSYICSCTDMEGYEYTSEAPSPSDCFTGSMNSICSSTGEYTITEHIECNTVFKKADGVVLAESASMYPNGDGTFAPHFVMPTSSHQQMRNDDWTKIRLTETFNGDLVPWFHVEKKQ